jgi:hypothetical protein
LRAFHITWDSLEEAARQGIRFRDNERTKEQQNRQKFRYGEFPTCHLLGVCDLAYAGNRGDADGEGGDFAA